MSSTVENVTPCSEKTHLVQATGRTVAQPTVKLRTTELAESGTVYRSRDMAEVKTFAKRALIVIGISPTKDQVCGFVVVPGRKFWETFDVSEGQRW